MSLLGLEVRSALRRIARAPAFSAGVVVTLALCIGANAVLATSIEGVLLRALPFHDPARLVWIWSTRHRSRPRLLLTPQSRGRTQSGHPAGRPRRPRHLGE